MREANGKAALNGRKTYREPSGMQANGGHEQRLVERALHQAGLSETEIAGVFDEPPYDVAADASDVSDQRITNGSATAQPKPGDFPCASAAMLAIQTLCPDARFCGSRQKGKATEKGWHHKTRPVDPALWGNWNFDRTEWYCVNMHSIGLYLVDLDCVLTESIDGVLVPRPGGATKDEALELEALLGGKACKYESSRAKGKWHLVYPAAPNGGMDWCKGELPDAPAAGFASQGGLMLRLASGDVAKFDLRGGGIKSDGKVNGCRIDADKRRLVMLLRALHGKDDLAPIEHPERLVEAYTAAREKKVAGKPVQDGAGGVHDELRLKVAQIARMRAFEQPAALDALKAWARRLRGDERDTDKEIDDLYSGSLAYVKEHTAPGADGGLFERQRYYDDLDDMVQALNRRYAAYTGKETRIIDELSTEASDDIWPVALSKTAFIDMLAHVKVRIETESGEQKWAQASYQWLKHPDRKRYKGQMELLGPDEERRNPYAYPIRITPPTHRRKGDATMLEGYLRDTICNGDERIYEWLADWLADAVQRPWDTGPGTAVLLTGAKGAGKSMLFEHVLAPVLGLRHCASLNDVESKISGGFNHDLMGKTIVFADEVIFSGNAKLAQRLKHWTMAVSFTYERKFQDPVTVRNTNRLLAASNDKVAAMLEQGDRRYLVIKTPLKYTDDEIDRGVNVVQFAPFVKWAHDNVDVMTDWFLSRKYDRDRLRTPPNTDAKRRSVLGSNRVLQVLVSLAQDGVIPGDTKGAGVVSTTWITRESGDRYASSRDVLYQMRDLVGEDNLPEARGARDVMQVARKNEGFVARLGKRGRGVRLPTPVGLAQILNPMLPVEDKITDAADTWEQWAPDAETAGGESTDLPSDSPTWQG